MGAYETPCAPGAVRFDGSGGSRTLAHLRAKQGDRPRHRPLVTHLSSGARGGYDEAVMYVTATVFIPPRPQAGAVACARRS